MELMVLTWVAVFLVGLIFLVVNYDEINVVECFVWSTLGLPLCVAIYLLLSPIMVLAILPMFIKKVVKGYITRAHSNAKQ